jgi:hypothetical protein
MSTQISKLSGFLFQRCASRRRARMVPRLEALEDRSVPAGVVNATFAAGVLTITAVDDPTDVNFTDTNHQNITLVTGWSLSRT